MCASPMLSPCLAHGVVRAPSCTAHLAPGPVRVHSCLPPQGLCKHGEGLVPWLPSADEAPPWRRATPSQGSQLSLCCVAAPQGEDTQPRSSYAPTGESRKCGRAKIEKKMKSQQFWSDLSQAMLGAVHSKAPHMEQSHLSAYRALLPSFVLQLGT